MKNVIVQLDQGIGIAIVVLVVLGKLYVINIVILLAESIVRFQRKKIDMRLLMVSLNSRVMVFNWESLLCI